jgi:hypothetical protein
MAAVALCAGAGVAQAQYSDGTIKIGVMNDQSGTYADLSGQGSVWAARKAIDDFCKTTKCHDKIEVVFADHQNKPDIGSNVVRQWYDVDKVDVVVDVPTSSVALAVNNITKEKNKVFLVSGAAASDLTGKACTPNTIHWTYDTWALANGTGNAIVKTGGDTWFFITADYAFGHALERDTAAVVEKNGGKVLGKVRHPFPGQDFSSFLLQAQASKANHRPCQRRLRHNQRDQAGSRVRHRPGWPEPRGLAGLHHRRACARPEDIARPDLHRGLVLGRQRQQPRLCQGVRTSKQGQHADHGAGGRLLGRHALPEGRA